MKTEAAGANNGRHYPYLDGIRGFAALYVVLHHAFVSRRVIDDLSQTPSLLQKILRLTDFGHYAVAVFIVLSGYCLMLPVVHSASEQIPGGFRGYLGRRARRILPPYYAALALSLVLIQVLHLLKSHVIGLADFKVETITPSALLTHLLLVHNASMSLRHTINPPMWTVATEWQIYFLFPLVLLPIRRRLGLTAAVAAGFVLGLAPHFLFHGALDSVAPWYIGLFALGMAGAEISFSTQPAPQRLRRQVPWGLLSCLIGAGFMVVGMVWTGWMKNNWCYSDSIVGAFTMCFLIYCIRIQQSSEEQVKPIVFRLLTSRMALELGALSYSLYLVHFPLQVLISVILRPMHLSAVALIGGTLLIETPLIIGFAFLFSQTFEHRLKTHIRKGFVATLQLKAVKIKEHVLIK